MDERETIYVTADEMAEFLKFQAEKAKKAEEERVKAEREQYKQLVDEEIDASIPILLTISDEIKKSKSNISK